MPKYVRHKGSPHIFEQESGRYVPYGEAKKKKIWGDVQNLSETIPEEMRKKVPKTWDKKPSPEGAEATADELQKGTDQMKTSEEDVFDTSKTEDLTAFLEGLKTHYTSELEKIRKEREEAKKEQKSLLTKFKEKTIDRSKLLQEQREKYGMEKNLQRQQTLIDEAAVLRNELVDLKEDKQRRLTEEEGKPLSTDYIQGRKALIERQYNSRIAAKSARVSARASTIQALQGNLSQARTLANEMVNAEVWDAKVQRDNIAKTMDINSDLLNDLGEEYQTKWNAALETAEDQYRNKKDKANRKKKLFLRAAEEGINLGDVSDMTLTEVQNAYAEQVSAKVRAEEAETTGAGTLSERQAEERREAQKQLNASRGEDGYVDPNVYTQQRRQYTGSPTEFDSYFAKELSPQERRRLGIAEDGGLVELTDEQIRAHIREDMNADASYQEVIDGITLNEKIANKDRAKEIAAKMYGITEETEETKKEKGEGWGALWSPEKTPTKRKRSAAPAPGLEGFEYTQPSLPDSISNLFQ